MRPVQPGGLRGQIPLSLVDVIGSDEDGILNPETGKVAALLHARGQGAVRRCGVVAMRLAVDRGSSNRSSGHGRWATTCSRSTRTTPPTCRAQQDIEAKRLPQTPATPTDSRSNWSPHPSRPVRSKRRRCCVRGEAAGITSTSAASTPPPLRRELPAWDFAELWYTRNHPAGRIVRTRGIGTNETNRCDPDTFYRARGANRGVR